MLIPYSDNELLTSVYTEDGLSGLIAMARNRQKEGRYAGAALATAMAVSMAPIVIETEGKTILIDLKNGFYTVFVWIPEYNAFADFGFSAGIGYGSHMVLKVIVLRLIDALDFLEKIEVYLTSDPVAFSKFRDEFKKHVADMRRTFSVFV